MSVALAARPACVAAVEISFAGSLSARAADTAAKDARENAATINAVRLNKAFMLPSLV
jgi:hypothetical protein